MILLNMFKMQGAPAAQLWIIEKTFKMTLMSIDIFSLWYENHFRGDLRASPNLMLLGSE
jgi:hypothetical protein